MSSAPRQSPLPSQPRGVLSSENVEIGIPAAGESGRPPAVKHSSTPAYQSPLRHHHREASHTREVKETLNARTGYSSDGKDGPAQQMINQYLIKEEIGRGSFGSVHLAVDQYSQEYAVKEFSKSKLRKRLQSNLLRRPDVRRRAGGIFNYRQRNNNVNDPLDLIREEIAIMKKLHHPNIVSLVEVLDDPDEDSLYMVMEMCNKGVVMTVGLEDRADPYDDEQCRHWFRDMILGIEYLHAQGIIHRDIKPDNCLVTEDDVLKITDFGVSEMFEKDSDMHTYKSAGSPAFMPPELCVAQHDKIDGKAADLWSMGVTLFCLHFGKIPFERSGMLELYESIRNDPIAELDPQRIANDVLADLLSRLLEKDPQKRIDMDGVRAHPWVTKGGTDPLLSMEENTGNIIEPPTEEEINAAITGKMSRLITVMRAVKRFKGLLFRQRPGPLNDILGHKSRITEPPLSINERDGVRLRNSVSVDVHDRRPVGGVLAAEGVHHDIPVSENLRRVPDQIDKVAILVNEPGKGVSTPGTTNTPQRSQSDEPDASRSHGSPEASSNAERVVRTDKGRGHAHTRDPQERPLYLNIGTGADLSDHSNESGAVAPTPDEASTVPVVSESPSALDMNVFERAYEEEVRRIQLEHGGRGSKTLYLTRRVEGSKKIRQMSDFIAQGREDPKGATKSGLAGLLRKAANVKEKVPRDGGSSAGGGKDKSGPSRTQGPAEGGAGEARN